jgi:hypothetical protein
MQPLLTLGSWAQNHSQGLIFISTFSLVSFFGSLLLLPWLIIRIPEDYFGASCVDFGFLPRHPFWKLLFRIGKNLLGVAFVIVGILMLVLPGQGLLTLCLGLIFIDFPGKRKLENGLIRKKSILGVINSIRAKAKRPPLQIELPNSSTKSGVKK